MKNLKLTDSELNLLIAAIANMKNIQMSALRFNEGTLNDELYKQSGELGDTYDSLIHKILQSSLVQN